MTVEFIVVGKYKKKYLSTCGICGVSKGYRLKQDMHKPCHPCSIKLRNAKLNIQPPPNVSSTTRHGVKLYLAACSLCLKDRGFIAKADLNKTCRSCAKTKPKIFDLNKELRNRLRSRMKNSINRALKRRNGSKMGQSITKILPYSIEELKSHLESKFQPGMTWENYGKWHIDHIVPDSWFTYSSIFDKSFQDSWALTNLQPLWAKDNLVKSNKYSG